MEVKLIVNFPHRIRSSDSVTRLSTVRGPAVTWSYRFLHPTVETLAVVVRDKDDNELIKIYSAITIEDTIEVGDRNIITHRGIRGWCVHYRRRHIIR